MKMFCDLVPPVLIPDERMREIESELAAAGRLTLRYHSSCSGKSRPNFFAEFARQYKDGEDASVFGVFVPAADAKSMFRAKELEQELLAGFSRMIDLIVRVVSSRFNKDSEELAGEAFWGFFQALVHYNGESKFSTFLQICLQRHLSRFCSDETAIKIPQEVRRTTMRLVDKMARDGLSFDEVVESEGLTQEKTRGVVAAMTRVRSATDLDIRESEMASSEDRPVPRGVMKIVEEVKLTRLERAVLQGFLDAPTGELGLSKGCAEMLNPETGRPYSRTAISLAWKQARKKISVALKDVA